MTSETRLKLTSPALQRIQLAAVKLFAERGDTHVSVNDLAQAAGVARGTIYNNVRDPDALFEEVAAQLGAEMHERISLGFGPLEDPALRLSQGVRQFVRREHEEPHWGRFLTRFGFSSKGLHHMWVGQPVQDLMAGIAGGRFVITVEQLPSVVSLIAGACLGAMFLVLEVGRRAPALAAAALTRRQAQDHRHATRHAATRAP